MGADDAAADHAVRRFVEQQLGEALVTAVGDGSPRRSPWEDSLADLDAFGLALLFGLAGPGQIAINGPRPIDTVGNCQKSGISLGCGDDGVPLPSDSWR